MYIHLFHRNKVILLEVKNTFISDLSKRKIKHITIVMELGSIHEI